jgi:hypothetical protein
VGDFKVVAVTPVQVEWEHEGKRTVLAVGKQIEIAGTTTESFEPPPAETTSTPAESSTPPAPVAGTPSRDGESRDRGQGRERERGRDSRGQSRYGGQSQQGGAAPASQETAAPSSTSTSGSSSDPAEMKRLMMERRQKETSK